MKRFSEYYKVVAMDNSHGLYTVHNDSFNGIVQDIRDAVEKAKAQGYDNDEMWLIVHVEVETEKDNNVFKSCTTTETAVGFYDNGNVVRY